MKTQIKKLAEVFLIVCVLALTSACQRGVRTIFVPNDMPVRLINDVPNVRALVIGENGDWVETRVTLRGGYYCLPLDPTVDEITNGH